ncbi:hypothetical protein D3C80_1131450 [compost metagenome]
MNFYPAWHTADSLGGFIDLVIGCLQLLIDALLATFLDAFASLDQLIEVVRALLPHACVRANPGQPDLACVAAHLAQGARGVVLFLHVHFGHAVYLMLMSGNNRP